MPATFASRRGKSSRRQNSEEIEDDSAGGTQPRQTDDVSDVETSQPRPKVEKGTAPVNGKGKEKKPTAPQDSDDEGGDDDEGSEDEVIDIRQLKDQPLSRNTADKGLKGLYDDWESLEGVTRQQWTMIGEIAAAIADVTDEDQAEKPIQKLDEIMRELVDLSHEMISHGESVNEIRQKILQGQEIDNAFEQYLETAERKTSIYKKQTTRQKYAKNDGYSQFRSAVWEVQNPDAPMPPLTDFISKEAGDDSDDEDLEVGGQTQDFKCPITLGPLVNPLTSKQCGHSFDAKAIEAMLGRDGAPRPCPAAGCRKKITLNDCKRNPELAKKAKRYADRIARQEEEDHSDVDEVIE